MSHFIYKHVIIVGVDGAGQFFRDAATPNFDRIFGDGSVTYSAYASNPTVSAECWGSMLLGVSPKIHGLTNDIVGRVPYPTDSPYPSLFRRIRNAHPDAVLCSYCDWDPISLGIVEDDAGVDKYSDRDEALVPRICDCIREKKPEFLFMQFDSIDGFGHFYGYGSKKHIGRIELADKFIGEIHEAVCDAGIADSTLFVVIADHGGTYVGEDMEGDHGGWTEREKLVTFAVAGKNVKKGEMGDANVRDLAAVVLYALGIEAPEFDINGWTSQIPEGMFDEEGIPEYKDISFETGAEPRISKAPHKSEKV